MKFGLTYDLRQDYLAAGFSADETAEFDRPDTITALEAALHDLGHETDRIGNVWALVKRLAAGDRWGCVFNIAEGLRGVGRESQVPALLDAYDIPYTFSDPLVLALSLHKGLTKRVLRDLGLPTADFCVVASEADLAQVELPYPLFAKPVAEGTAKGIDADSKLATPAALAAVCRRLVATYQQPVLVETYLPGREFTVGIVGTGAEAEALGTLEVILLKGAEPHSYTYVNKERCEELCEYRLVTDDWARRCEGLAVAAWRGLGCRDGGRVDLRADAAGKLHILELNPLAGLHPEHSDLPILCHQIGMSYLELIRRIVKSAERRISA